MEIVNHRQKYWMLWKVVLSEIIILLCYQRDINTENVKGESSIKKKLEEVRKRITLLSFPVNYLGQLV